MSERARGRPAASGDSGPEVFIDREAEREALGDILLHNSLEGYVEAAYLEDHFFDERHRPIFKACLELHAAGVPTDMPAVRAWLRDHHSDVSDAYLCSLADGVPRQSPSAVRERRTRLDRFFRCRTYYYRSRRDEVRLLEDPSLIDNGFILGAMAELEELQPRAAGASLLLDDVAVLNTPDPTYLVENRIPANALVTGYGPSGIGKTFVFSIDLGLSVAAGRPWLGAPIVTRGPVIAAMAEGVPAPRVGAWKLAFEFNIEASLGFHVWPGAVPLLEPQAVSAFIAASKSVQPVLVILDTLARCLVGGDENSAKDMGLAIAAADRIRRALGATVLLVHHTNKDGGSERGSSALRGACDTMLELRQVDDLLELSCSKQKEAEPFEPLELKLVPAYPGAASVVVRLASEVTPDGNLSDSQGKALHALRELFGEVGATGQEWEDSLQGLHRSTFFRARKVLIDRGFVRQANKRYFPTEKTTVAASRTAVALPYDRI